MLWLGACAPAKTAPAPSRVFVFRPAPGPAVPLSAPWHEGLRTCTPPPPYLGVEWSPVGDIDGDGRGDFLETTCDAANHECVMQLCLATQEGFAYAAAWRALGADSIVALAGPPPRDFEAFVVEPEFPGGPSCAHGRRFSWDGTGGAPGYLSTDSTRCACSVPPGMKAPHGCYRAGR